MITSSLGGKPILQPQVPDPSVNWFASGTGAGKYGHGLFLLQAADYDAIVPSSGTGTVKLVMQDQRGDAGKLSIDVLVASAMPYVGKGDGTGLQGVVVVQVYDLRYQKDFVVTRYANVQKSNFSHNGSDQPEFVADSLASGTTEYTWATLIPQIEGAPTLPTNPTWKPRNIVIAGWQAHRVVDWIAANLFLVTGWDYANALFKYHDPGVMTDDNKKLFDAATGAGLLVSGGVGKRNTKRLPRNFSVKFSSWNLSDNSAITQADYTKSVTTSGDGSIQPLHVGSYVAAYKGSSTLNTSTLDAVATDLAARAYKFISVPPAVYDFAGIVPFNPDGAIRDILWSTSAAGARTRMMQGVRFDWSQGANGGLWGFADPAIPGAMPRLEFPSNQLVTGLAGAGSSIDPGGMRYVWAASSSPGGAILVQCVNDNGAATSVVSVQKVDGTGSLVSGAFDVRVIYHTVNGDQFYAEPASGGTAAEKYVQIGLPPQRAQFAVLSVQDAYGIGQSVDWDYPKGHV